MSPSVIEEAREALRVFLGCSYKVCTSIDPRGYSWSEAWLDEARPIASRALAALNEGAVSGLTERAGEGWRPMESAPRDGTEIMLWAVPRKGYYLAEEPPRMVLARWLERSQRDLDAGYHPGWVWYGSAGVEFTHWQPLPAPPAPAETGTLANQETDDE